MAAICGKNAMFDVHLTPDRWGLCPRILGVSSYGLFVLLGIAAGAAYYFYDARKRRTGGEQAAFIVLGALLGAALGAKLLVMALNFPLFLSHPQMFTTGKTVLGGFLGGFLGILLVKRLCHIRGRYGNQIAPAAALGLAIGRVGCLLAGCCYGRPGPWGFDFGDGVTRLPTQIMELAFHGAAFCVLHSLKDRVRTPGILFRGYVCAYLIFRFLTEYLRESAVFWIGLTVYQAACLAGLALLGARLLMRMFKEKKERKGCIHGKRI